MFGWFNENECPKLDIFNSSLVDFGLNSEKAIELFGEDILKTIYESTHNVNIISAGSTIDEFRTLIFEYLEFCDCGAATAVWHSESHMPNRVLKVPFLNPIGRTQIIEVLEKFKGVDSARINRAYKNLTKNLSDKNYNMLYNFFGNQLNILHKIVAHNRFHYSVGFKKENPRTPKVTAIVTIGNLPVAYLQEKVYGGAGSLTIPEHKSLLDEYDCLDNNPENIRVAEDNTLMAIDVSYPAMSNLIKGKFK